MSRVVFVGNIPYSTSEDQLIDVFKTVGNVVGFRLVYDRDTHKPRGYGFCEFSDHQTAQSAVRNLNGKDVGGRALRIDIADSDPFLEGRTTNRGELMDGPENRLGPEQNIDILHGLPPGLAVPPGMTSMDMITNALTNLKPAQILDVLAQMKTFVTSYPAQAHELLSHNPQLACALFQALIMNEIVDPSVIERMQAAAKAALAAKAPVPVNAMPPPLAPHMQQYPGYPGIGVPPHIAQPPNFVPSPAPGPPMSSTPTIPNNFYRPPVPQAPPVQPATPTQSTADQSAEQQRSMLMQVLQLTQEQVNALPPGEKAVVEQLRGQLYGALQNPAASGQQ